MKTKKGLIKESTAFFIGSIICLILVVINYMDDNTDKAMMWLIFVCVSLVCAIGMKKEGEWLNPDEKNHNNIALDYVKIT